MKFRWQLAWCATDFFRNPPRNFIILHLFLVFLSIISFYNFFPTPFLEIQTTKQLFLLYLNSSWNICLKIANFCFSSRKSCFSIHTFALLIQKDLFRVVYGKEKYCILSVQFSCILCKIVFSNYCFSDISLLLDGRRIYRTENIKVSALNFPTLFFSMQNFAKLLKFIYVHFW